MTMTQRLVRVHPLPDRYIPGVPHVVQDLLAAEAAALLAWTPPAFAVDPPESPPAPATEATEQPEV